MAEFPGYGLPRVPIDPPLRSGQRPLPRPARGRRLPARDLFVAASGIAVAQPMHPVQPRRPRPVLVDLQLLSVAAVRRDQRTASRQLPRLVEQPALAVVQDRHLARAAALRRRDRRHSEHDRTRTIRAAHSVQPTSGV